MYTRQLQSGGFSLVEVLVAITLLLIALIGPMSFLSRSSQSTEVANQRAVATFLAQEGIELVHKLRDDAVLETFPNEQNERWGELITQLTDQGCETTSGCAVQIDNNSGSVVVNSCASRNDCLLNLNSGANRSWYNHEGGGQPTIYTRRIFVAPDAENRELSITSEVTWRSSSFLQTQRVGITSSVFNVYYDN